MKLTPAQKIRRDCLPQFFQEKFNQTNGLIHFIDVEYELFLLEGAVKMSQLGKRVEFGLANIEMIVKYQLPLNHSTDTLVRAAYLANNYLEYLSNATNNLERT